MQLRMTRAQPRTARVNATDQQPRSSEQPRGSERKSENKRTCSGTSSTGSTINDATSTLPHRGWCVVARVVIAIAAATSRGLRLQGLS